MVVADRPLDVLPMRTGSALVLRLRPAIDLTRDQFFRFCQLNPEARIERMADGDIAIMASTGGETSARNLRLSAQVGVWAEEDGSGVAFDSSAGFELPDGSVRSPDVAWVPRTRLARLTAEEKRRFLPLCPDFVIELSSPSDSVTTVQRKMEEYRANGTRLGWLTILHRRVAVYRPDGSVVWHEQPASGASRLRSALDAICPHGRESTVTRGIQRLPIGNPHPQRAPRSGR